jgi:hypothetical protein
METNSLTCNTNSGNLKDVLKLISKEGTSYIKPQHSQFPELHAVKTRGAFAESYPLLCLYLANSYLAFIIN